VRSRRSGEKTNGPERTDLGRWRTDFTSSEVIRRRKKGVEVAKNGEEERGWIA